MFKPMLACDADLRQLKFPVAASPKLDGVRAIVKDGVLLSRSLKPIRNAHTSALFKHLEGFDGELIVGAPTAPDCYRKTMSGVMSYEGTPDVGFYVFDHIEHPFLPWEQRRAIMHYPPPAGVHMLEHELIHDADELLEYETHALAAGYEGVMLRNPHSPYKHGRSTVAEGYLLKLKRSVDAEFIVIGFEERMHNANVLTTSELGYAKRSSHKENMVPRGDLGALVLAGDGYEFRCGTGFTDGERASIWERRDSYIGKAAKVKYLPVGVKTAPRHPVFLGWRDPIDL